MCGTHRELGLWLVMAWTVWVLAVALVLCTYAKDTVPTQWQLKEVFQNLKASFVVCCTVFFCTSCLHPEQGFLDAQRELTVLTIVLPITYVVLYQVSQTHL